MLKEKRLEEARHLFDSQRKTRPDLFLPDSDIYGELKAIYEQLLSGDIRDYR